MQKREGRLWEESKRKGKVHRQREGLLRSKDESTNNMKKKI